LFAIGAGAQVVGVSDYCNHPAAARERAKAGTSITPRFEAIVHLAPSLIVTEGMVNARPENLERLARTVEVPWLSLTDVVSGTRRLGELTGKTAQAELLAARLQQRLSVPEPKLAPSVLLVLGYAGEKLDEVWFIRRNSIHGAALRAAGGKNAVARDIHGQPRLSLERVLALDPDIVMVLLAEAGVSTERVQQQWQKVTALTAVKQGRVVVVRAPEAFANGPRILDLADKLQAELEALRSS
jgi:iron complex transport system substrate-binding protein